MKETTAKKRGLSSDRIFDIFNYALMAVIMIVVAYPLYYVPHRPRRGSIWRR